MDSGMYAAAILVLFDILLTLWALNKAAHIGKKNGQEAVFMALRNKKMVHAIMESAITELFSQVSKDNMLDAVKKYFLVQNKEGQYVLTDESYQLLNLVYMEAMGMFQRSTDGKAGVIERRGSGGPLMKKSGWMHDMLEIANHPLVKSWLQKKDMID